MNKTIFREYDIRGVVGDDLNVETVELLEAQPRPTGEPSAVVAGLGEVFVPLHGSVDSAVVREHLERDLTKVGKELKGVETKLARADFLERAPAEIVDKERQRAHALRDRRSVLERHLGTLGKVEEVES